jgi:hypothetical protein
MDAHPKRRRFRFRLSTVLILTAITAWGMTIPRCVRHGAPYFVHYLAAAPPPPGAVDRKPGQTAFLIYDLKLNPAVLRPALTLAVFLDWKAVWAILVLLREIG